MNYFLRINGTLIGPMSAQQLMAYDVNPNIAVSIDGGISWQPLYAYPELMEAYNNSRRNNSYANNLNDCQQPSDSKRILCGIMAILLGSIGIHYFIIGKTTAGILTIVLSILTCGAWQIITFIQGIMMLCMNDYEFEQKYVLTEKSFPLF